VAENPYVGPRPFERGEGAFFFGREREVQELLSLVVAHRVVLLYAASGAGKTSLLNAGLGPLLDHEEGFELLPTARVRALSANDPPVDADAYAFGVLTHLMPEAELVGHERETLAGFLARREHPVGEDGFPAPRALIVDQLEEVFTLYQERWSEREEFFRQLAEALDADPLLRIVLAIREDYVAHLDPFARLLPTALRTRMRLERLGRESALRAATEPARRAGRSFAPGVAEKLVDDLLEMRVDMGGGQTRPVPGEYVEPVQLQVACRSLWSRLPPDATEITEEHRLVFGDVDQVLSQFYEETIAAAAARGNLKGDELRERFATAFITPLETRGTVYWTPTTTAGMPAEAIEEMDRRHLIRAEVRAGARWYELTHDRLIGPVRASNRARRAALAARRRRRAGIGSAVVFTLLAAALGLALLLRPVSTPAKVTSRQASLERRIAQQARGISSLALILHAHGGKVIDTSFSPGDKLLLTLSNTGLVEVWTTIDGQRKATFRAKGAYSAAFPPTGYGARGDAPILTASNSGSAVLHSQRGKTIALLPSGYVTVLTPRFTTRGPGVVAANRAGQAAFWNGKTLVQLRGSSGVLVADVSGDGRRIAIATGDDVEIWTSTGKRLGHLRPAPAAFPPLLSFDGARVAIAESTGKVTVWDTRTRKDIAMLPATDKPVISLALSRNGAIVAAADGTTTARLLTLPEAKVLKLKTNAPITDIALSFDGQLAVTAAANGTARLWSTGRLTGGGKKLRAVLGGQTGRVVTASFSHNARLIATGAGDGTARVWGAVADLRITGIRTLDAGVEVTVENLGNGSSAPTLVMVVTQTGHPQEKLAAIRPGDHQRVMFPGVFRPVGAIVDPDHSVPELDDGNNARLAPHGRPPTVLTVGTTTTRAKASLREQIVAAALRAAKDERFIHYTSSPQRMSGVRRKIRLPHVPPYEDTSSFVTWCYWQADAPDPSGLGYNGFEWSGSLITHGHPVTRPQLGDIAFYGPSLSSPQYVAIYVGGGKVVAHTRESGPDKRKAKAPNFLQYRSYP
jgi:cell wall-associated NlpC family hydrolase